MQAEPRVPILMTKTERGGIDGLFPMLFEVGKVYMCNISLVRQFMSMQCAVCSAIPKAGAYHLYNADLPTRSWQLVAA